MVNMSTILRRNIDMWGLLLLYSNSFLNAIIVLTRSSNLQTTKRKIKT